MPHTSAAVVNANSAGSGGKQNAIKHGKDLRSGK
jgi:hypothetical protein